MILDASAIVAILNQEPGFLPLAEHVRDADDVSTGAPTLVETEMVLVGRLGQQGRVLLQQFVREQMVRVIPFGDAHWREAGRAFLLYGKGRHAAGLNLGDCMSYATAKIAGEPLLALGDDFAKTDLELA